jgi:transposase
VDTLESTGEAVPMSRRIYPPEFRAHLVSLVRQGRTPESLSKEFEPSAPTIRAWVEEADGPPGEGPDPRDAELRELRRKVAVLEEEREILKKAAAWFAAESGSFAKKGSRS